MLIRSRAVAMAAAISLAACGSALAQKKYDTGATDTEIKIGNIIPYRGPATEPEKQQSGTELVTTVVQAAGELAQVGLSIGGQVLKRAVDRLPRP